MKASEIGRVFLIVLDGLGIGEAPDAALFGDAGADTMRSISRSEHFSIPNLLKAGISEIEGLSYLGKPASPYAAYGKMKERSAGKDTTIGHWELSGLISKYPLPTYPNGFPDEILRQISEVTQRGILCNRPYSGTDVIRDYGNAHRKSGDLILYTSADSVLQIAAHEEIVPIETLYEYCQRIRVLMTGKHGVGRIIARPFLGEDGAYYRTANRRDFSLVPPQRTLLDAIQSQGLDVISVGKISDIFAGRGITKSVLTHGNAEGMKVTEMIAATEDFHGLCFVNLVDFDMVYGHRNDVDGYAKALSDFDAWLPTFLAKMRPSDVLILTGDHGCDPGDSSTDHTREYTPMLCIGTKIRPIPVGTRGSFADIAATIADFLNVPLETEGKSFASEVLL